MKIVILGAGFAGHTAALHLAKLVKNSAEIIVISPKNRFTWFPSLVWVGTDTMSADDCIFELTKVYEKLGVKYIAGKATTIWPYKQLVDIELDNGKVESVHYDFLVNGTGPYLNFEGTPGLGPATGNSFSICTVEHSLETRSNYLKIIQALKRGQKQTIAIGVGHPLATCEGAAFEYLLNIDFDLRKKGVRDLVSLNWLSNEPEVGDFGVDGIETKKNGTLISGASTVRALLDKHDIKIILPAGVTKVEPGLIHYEKVGEDPSTLKYDFAMLLPQFRGIPLKYLADDETDITAQMTQSNGFMTVDADYTPKKYENYRGNDWPEFYVSPQFPNIFAPGIAFAPPHSLSKPKQTNNGLVILATTPRTGMASGIMGRTVARNIACQITGQKFEHGERLSQMPAACIASTGNDLWSGGAVSIVMAPVARDYERYPKYGRDLNISEVEYGLAGAWTKRLLHHVFMWKLQAKPGWEMIPE